MADYEDLELTFSNRHPKLQLYIEILFYEKIQKTRRKYLQQLKIKRRNHNKMGRKSKVLYNQDHVGDSPVGG